MSGRSSGVEHNLAKVGVGRSNRLARSIFFPFFQYVKPFEPVYSLGIPTWGKR